MSEPVAPGRPFFGYLLLTAALCGALVMVIEVLGSRVIGPFFGVSLYVWTSLISVTLISLALGYAGGGWLADRRDRAGWLYAIIALAGIATLLIPLLRAPLLALAVPLGLRAGSFVATLLLFGPALLLLGAVSPYLVKLASRQTAGLGMTVGGFYALSTLGSVAGTVLTGFVLISAFGVDRIFTLTGTLLLLLAAGYFLLFARRPGVLALLLLALPGWFAQAPPFERRQADGTLVTEVERIDSYYGQVRVIDYRYRNVHTREMAIDGLVQGGVDVGDGLSVYEYAYFLQFLPRALHPAGRTALMIGVGAGIVPRWYAGQGVAVDVVDIDPAVVELAERHFGPLNARRVVFEDARAFLAASRDRYDYLLLDVFNGDTTPGHLLSREAVALMAERLAERGVLAVNLIGSLRREPRMTASVVRTLRESFDQVEITPTFDPSRGDGEGNLVIVAYRGPSRGGRPELLSPVHRLARNGVVANLARRFVFPEGAPSMVLTDDYNPIDVHDAWLREKVRRTILQTTDWALLGGS